MADPHVGQVPEELQQLRALYAERTPRRVLEIGVWHGGTLREWLAGDPDVVVAVDPHPQTDKSAPNLVLLVGRSQDDHIQRQIREHGPYDWIFIDGDHEYAAAKADADLAFSVINVGGLILLHDITTDGRYDEIGPERVFSELSRNYRTWSIIADPQPSGYPSSNAHGIGVVEP